MSRPIYIVAAEYSAPPGTQRVESVFDRTRGAEPPALLPLMENAARRALDGLPSRAKRQARIDHLLLTTMPIRGPGAGDLRLPDDAMNLTGLLQRSLELPDHCVTRFELGSSDGGAALFASGVRLLQGVSEPTTALLVAGQVMPRGAAAIETVAQVIEVSERQLGLRMIPVGDLLLDAFWARLCERSGGSPGPGEGPQNPSELAGRLAASKLRLAAEYPAAMRRDADAEALSGRPLARWLHDAHVAHACNGACAVILTTDESVVEALIASGHRRLVRVLGVGEGNDDPVLTRRPEPLMLFKAMRQSLVFLRRAVGAHVDFLRGSAFAIFHDAFPSIELGFLTALGFDAADAVDRAGSYWSNPYGGLTAFGHAMAASGMVQIAKAWHVLTRPEAYLPPRVDAPSRHPDHTRSAIPIHCLTTSVGGPMTHVVASLLQSVPVEDGRIPPPFALDRSYELPLDARRPDAAHIEPWTFEGKTDWAAARGQWYRARCAGLAAELGLDGVGVVIGRTRLDLRSVALPLPDGFLDAWTLPDFVDGQDRHHPLPRGKQALLTGALSTSRQAVETAVEALVSWLAGEGGEPEPDKARRRVLRRGIYARLRPPVALIDGGGAAFETPHGLCLLPDEAIPVGALVAVHDGAGGLAHVGATLSDEHAALIPPWYGAPAGDDRTPLLELPRDEAEAVGNLIRVLRSAPMTAESWGPIFTTTERLLEALARTGRPATEWLRRLLQTLMFAPDPDRWTIAEALEILCGVQAARPPADELTGYVEFDLWRAGDRPPEELARLFDTVEEAISRARGWLGGSDLHLSRLGDTYAAIARRRPPAMSTRLGAELWPQVLRFARDVYDACLRRGVPLRVVVDVSTEGMPMVRRGAYLGVAGAGPVEARLVMTSAPHFMRRSLHKDAEPPDEVGAGHGIALVRSGAALAASDTELAHWADARWSEVGGLDGFVVDCARIEDRAFYHIGWRPTGRTRQPVLRPATPFDARDDVVGVLCYSAADRAAAAALDGALRAMGCPLWADEPLEAGDFWTRQIDARETQARIALLLVGEQAHGWKAPGVRQRIARMVAAGVRLLPVILPGASPDAWPLMQGGLWQGAPIALPDPADAGPLRDAFASILGGGTGSLPPAKAATGATNQGE